VQRSEKKQSAAAGPCPNVQQVLISNQQDVLGQYGGVYCGGCMASARG